MAAELYVANDNLIKISNVRDALTGEDVADMTGTVTLYDLDGNALLGADGLEVSYATPVDGSAPFYYAEIDAAVQLAPGTKYKVVFDSDNYGVHLEREFPAAVRRG